MKDFFIVLKFEFMNFLKNKAFIISTVVLCALLIIGLSVPTIKNTFFGDGSSEDGNEEVQKMEEYGLIDNTDGKIDIDLLKENFGAGNLKLFTSKDQLDREVNSDKIEAGFILEDSLKYNYVIKNNEMIDFGSGMFDEALIETYRADRFKALNIDYNEVEDIINPEVLSETVVLGKDSASNFAYTYILVFFLYFMIIMYGQLIASAVASEKSNRAMEVLVTSTKPTNLIFGKVIAGALAGFAQIFVVMLTGFIVYNINKEAWDNSLDFLFDIPANVLVSFAIFGILGYLLYAFIYGALGALVSRTEDVAASSTPVMLIFVGVFMISIFGMQNTEGMLLKVASFVPFSSFMAMFVRVAMGSVQNWEIILSLVILIVTTLLIGILASKIYRMGTLRYGNPIKLRHALKRLKED